MKILVRIIIAILLAIFLVLLCARSVHAEERKGYSELEHFCNGVVDWYLLFDPRAALMEFILAETYDPMDAQLKKSIAEVYLDMGNYSQSLLKAQEAMTYINDDGELYRIAALAAAGMKNCKLSRKYAQRAYFPTQDEYLQIVWCFVDNEQYSTAISMCRNALKEHPHSSTLWAALGKIYISRGEVEKALEPTKKALKLNPQDDQAYIQLANIYIKIGKFRDAMKVLDRYVRLFPDDRSVFEQYMERALMFDSLRDAKSVVNRFIAHFPDGEIEALEGYASAAYVRGNYGEALNTFQHLVEITDTSEPNYLYFIGKCYDELWCPESAAVMYKMAIEKNPSPDLWTDLALVWARMDEPESLLITLKDASSQFPDSAVLWYWGGVALRGVGMWNLATHWFSEALKFNPDNVQTLFSLADTRERAGYRSESIALFEKINQLNPDDPTIQNYLGYILVDDSVRIEYGKQLIQKALTAEPDNPAYIDSYGWAFYREGKIKKALSYLKKAEELFGDDSEILFHLAKVYAALGDIENARKYAIKSIQINPQYVKARYFLQIIAGDSDEKSENR